MIPESPGMSGTVSKKILNAEIAEKLAQEAEKNLMGARHEAA